MEASQETQAEEQAASLPDELSEPNAPKTGDSEKARFKANQEEIQKLVSQLPDRVRDQMQDLFRARYTRIQKLDLENLPSEKEGNH